MSTDESAFFSTMSAYFGPGTDWRSSTGKGVTVAVIDSGIDDTHKDLSGRVVESVEARVEKNKVIFEPSEAVEVPRTFGRPLGGCRRSSATDASRAEAGGISTANAND